mgnify:CR=1 FL=1
MGSRDLFPLWHHGQNWGCGCPALLQFWSAVGSLYGIPTFRVDAKIHCYVGFVSPHGFFVFFFCIQMGCRNAADQFVKPFGMQHAAEVFFVHRWFDHFFFKGRALLASGLPAPCSLRWHRFFFFLRLLCCLLRSVSIGAFLIGIFVSPLRIKSDQSQSVLKRMRSSWSPCSLCPASDSSSSA